ncbi:NAD(P)/FAD-dependent oxidoreductase [Azospirillum sp. B4]|uniref:flavin-containing monooxygenase n=1 Tax=Azospirillum sp. B4 TaxID=95605 RepID=UPI00034D1715|nr:NAD(P)/FAD-dependent oxidoreductase [Azospirillum sp. B4]
MLPESESRDRPTLNPLGGLPDPLDVLIVGAGLSGIDAACRLTLHCPRKSWALVEARDRIGGTWDLFRYPGIRSDSDMHTLGFPFRPWQADASIADGPAIRDYIEDTASEFGLMPRIRLGWRVTRADWCSRDQLWTVGLATAEGGRKVRCRFLYLCSGYYRYDQGHTPVFPGAEDFRGRIVHPQHWPEDLEVKGRRVVVIGSGATAVTLVPALADRGAMVTMLQRSPTYIVSRPRHDDLGARLRRRLPGWLAAALVRWKYIGWSLLTYQLARRRPETVKRRIIEAARAALGDGIDVSRHFTPTYAPWDQRVCLVPDGDLFTALKTGAAEIATGRIARFTPIGIRLESGEEIDADVIITATGLEMRLLGGMEMRVDGALVNPGDRLLYQGMMLGDVPNHALAMGYVNASWTLKCDLTARAVCRLLNRMERHGHTVCVPRQAAAGDGREPLLGFASGYVLRARPHMPGQGSRPPWRVRQNYLADLAAFHLSSPRDAALAFLRPGQSLKDITP